MSDQTTLSDKMNATWTTKTEALGHIRRIMMETEREEICLAAAEALLRYAQREEAEVRKLAAAGLLGEFHQQSDK